MSDQSKNIEKFYDEIANDYDEVYSSAVEIAENKFLEFYVCGAIDTETDVILDAGCGTGLLLDLIDIDPERYIGIDISQKMIDIARRRFPNHKFICGDIMDKKNHKHFFVKTRPNIIVSLFGMYDYFGLDWLKASKDILDNVKGHKAAKLLCTIPNKLESRKIHNGKTSDIVFHQGSQDVIEFYFRNRRENSDQPMATFLHGFSYESLNKLDDEKVIYEYIQDSVMDLDESKYLILFTSRRVKNET